ncbi:hypothetical protein DFH09DRAFT_1374303, partial [Mycena vulgaris]
MGKELGNSENDPTFGVGEGAASGALGPDCPERFLSRDGKPIRVPKLPLAEFGQEYGVNETILKI